MTSWKFLRNRSQKFTDTSFYIKRKIFTANWNLDHIPQTRRDTKKFTYTERKRAEITPRRTTSEP